MTNKGQLSVKKTSCVKKGDLIVPASTGFVHQQETESGPDMLNEFIIICSVKDENTRLSGSYLDTGFKFKTKSRAFGAPVGQSLKK